MLKQIAYTATFGYTIYPEYINLSFADNGSNILTVRTQDQSNVSVINLPPEELMKFAIAMFKRAQEQGVHFIGGG